MPRRGDVEAELKNLVKFIENYKWLIDSYVSDFFVKNLSEKINPRWWKVLEVSEVEELATLLNSNTWTVRRVWPLSLLAFRKSLDRLSLERHCQQLSGPELSRLFGRDPPGSATVSETDPIQTRAVVRDGQNMLLEHCFRRHVKPKKQHEILNMSKALHNLAEVCRCDHIVDVGAGQGHLSRALSFGLGHSVTTIEAAGGHAPKARKFDGEVQKDIQKGRVGVGKRRKKNKSSPSDEVGETDVPPLADDISQPNHIVAMIDPSVSVDDFLGTLQLTTKPPSDAPSTDCPDAARVSDSCQIPGTPAESCDLAGTPADSCDLQNPPETSPDFILTGLHACGDLTPTMLRVFLKCPTTVGLGSVGCCYMKMSDRRETSSAAEPGYPMSEILQSLPQHQLSYEAREMACHFIDAYHTRLLENQPSLKTHCYRAALQEIIHTKDPNLIHGCIKLTFKQTHDKSFKEYAESALAKLKLEATIDGELLSKAEKRLEVWRGVVAFYTLRLSLAPVVETLILLDRVMYLLENGVQSHLVPIFDPLISPRNFILLSSKCS